MNIEESGSYDINSIRDLEKAERAAIKKLGDEVRGSYDFQGGEFVKVNPTISCIYYATGRCCHDKHFNASVIMPSAPNGALCGEQNHQSTIEKDAVNCKECLEMIHS